MRALAAAISPGGADHITDLWLGFNRVADHGMVALARSWADGGAAQLRELHLAGNQVADHGLAALADCLHAVPNLILLALGSHVGGNRVGDEGAEALARGLRMNGGRTLTVNLRFNPLSQRAAEALQQAARDGGEAMAVVV